MAKPQESVIKLMFLGNNGVGKTSLMRKFSPDRCHNELMMKPYGIEYTLRTIKLDNQMVKLQIWDTTVQERIWLLNIKEDHANIKKILVGNKFNKDESERAVSTARGEAFAKEYDIEFFETSAETNMNVEEVFFSIARDMLESKASRVAHEPQMFGD